MVHFMSQRGRTSQQQQKKLIVELRVLTEQIRQGKIVSFLVPQRAE